MRFNKPAYPTVYFSEVIWVKCPKCFDLAVVKTELPKYTIPFPEGHKSICNCNSCGFQDSENENWSGYVQGFINQACGNCGSRISHTTEPTRKPYKLSEITCEVCKSERDYKIKWYRYRNEKSTDPYFGFDLWLQANIKDKELWLYNIDHLDYLKEYVEASLREDDGRHKYSMITNLPQWIKSSKNRELIVKKLNSLKQEFEKKTVHNTLYKT
ncbi:hypothetical protein [Cellulophaga baltica]|uniref:hypothetical protein n=1 Tax=Cellulophaga baltica TaxID=76594 RepID=UPI0015F756DA|nr:hypothetical protein [Cellulophaga baltica]MBA6316803.1 hypothetical protein [Cellulophaga baltica]